MTAWQPCCWCRVLFARQARGREARGRCRFRCGGAVGPPSARPRAVAVQLQRQRGADLPLVHHGGLRHETQLAQESAPLLHWWFVAALPIGARRRAAGPRPRLLLQLLGPILQPSSQAHAYLLLSATCAFECLCCQCVPYSCLVSCASQAHGHRCSRHGGFVGRGAAPPHDAQGDCQPRMPRILVQLQRPCASGQLRCSHRPCALVACSPPPSQHASELAASGCQARSAGSALQLCRILQPWRLARSCSPATRPAPSGRPARLAATLPVQPAQQPWPMSSAGGLAGAFVQSHSCRVPPPHHPPWLTSLPWPTSAVAFVQPFLPLGRGLRAKHHCCEGIYIRAALLGHWCAC